MASTIAASAIASLLPVIMNKLFPGKQGEMKALPTMSGGQQDLFQQLLSGLSGGNAGGGAMGSGMNFLQGILGGDTSKFEAPLMRQFNEQTVPGIAERFSGMGAGSQGSGAFGQQLGAAGAGLSENLGALRGGLQMQALSPLMEMLRMGVSTPTFQWQQMPGSQGAGSAMAPGIGQGIGKGLANANYGNLWSQISSMFGGGAKQLPKTYSM